jgi:hypothetical protein
VGKHVPYKASELSLNQGVLFLNNFFCHFSLLNSPEETLVCEEFYPDGLYRMLQKDRWDVLSRISIKNFLLKHLSHVALDECCADRSDKRLDQTPRQFYAEVDGVVESLGISAEEIAKRINAVLMQRHDVSIEELRRLTAELDTFLLPIYIALREAGYNKADLWN